MPGTQKDPKQGVGKALGYVLTFVLFLARAQARNQRLASIILNWVIFAVLLFVCRGWANSGLSLKQKVVRWMVAAVPAFALCSLLGWWAIPPAQTVTISPAQVTFQNQWEAYSFYIKNGLDQTAYEVVVKLAYGVPSEEFKFAAPPTSSKPLGNAMGGYRLGDMIGISCRTEKGTYATFLVISRMDPGESRVINFTRLKPGAVGVQTRVSFFTETPRPFINSPTTVAQQDGVDENCTQSQIMFELK